MSLDRITEAAGRWLAARASRRTFLGWTGRTAVAVAGGTALTAVFQERASARLCGQSGVSPKCPTYDCYAPDIWGWCWYASPGCCAGGGIKKICDCCRTAHPNVHGYCPDGSNVYCIVESCLEDPRVIRVALERFESTDPVELAVIRSRTRPAGGSAGAVVAEAHPLAAAIAMPVAAQLGAPLLLIGPSGPSPLVTEELRRLGATNVVVVAPGIPISVTDGLRAVVANVERIVDPTDVATASVAVANWLTARSGASTAWCIGADGEATAVAPAVGALAAAERAPVLISIGAVGAYVGGTTGAAATITLVGSEAVGGRSALGATPTKIATSTSPDGLTRLLATMAVERAGAGTIVLVVAPNDNPTLAMGVMSPGGAMLVHAPAAFSVEARDWCLAHRANLGRIELLAGGPSGLPDLGVWEMQSACNGYDNHLLIGTGGQGLPVYAQPLEERPIGKVRVSGPLPDPTTTVLIGRAKAAKGPDPASPAAVPAPNIGPTVASTTTMASTTTVVRK